MKARKIDAILPYSLLRKPSYSVTIIMVFLSGTFISSVILIPSFAEQVLGIAATKSSYWKTPLAIASGKEVDGYFVDKQSTVKTLILSGIIASVGFGGFCFIFRYKNIFCCFPCNIRHRFQVCAWCTFNRNSLQMRQDPEKDQSLGRCL